MNLTFRKYAWPSLFESPVYSLWNASDALRRLIVNSPLLPLWIHHTLRNFSKKAAIKSSGGILLNPYLNQDSSLYPTDKKSQTDSDMSNNLIGYASLDKQTARDAVDELLQYKCLYGNFSSENIDNVPLAAMVMKRYQFQDIEDLNDWLSGF